MTGAARPDLYALLAVGPDISAERLRLAYEFQVNAAVRGNDRRRALELSQAFDALPPATRRAMYSASPAEDRWVPPGPPPGRRRRRTRRARVQRRRLPGDDPRWRTPLIVALSIAGVLGLLWYVGVLPALLGVG